MLNVRKDATLTNAVYHYTVLGWASAALLLAGCATVTSPAPSNTLPLDALVAETPQVDGVDDSANPTASSNRSGLVRPSQQQDPIPLESIPDNRYRRSSPTAPVNRFAPNTSHEPSFYDSSSNLNSARLGSAASETADSGMVIRAQSPDYGYDDYDDYRSGGSNGYPSRPQPVSGANTNNAYDANPAYGGGQNLYDDAPRSNSNSGYYDDRSVQPSQYYYGEPYDENQATQAPPGADRYNGQGGPFGGYGTTPPLGPAPGYGDNVLSPPGGLIDDPYNGRYADVVVNVQEQQTGRFMFGVGVNSDAGLTAQVVIDEYNFDWRRPPRGIEDVINGTAWRGGGQRLRIEAVPGSQLQRYMINFTEPYLMDTPISLNLSGFLYDRRYFDWDEQRLGGRIGLGYRLTPDLSLSTGMRLENVNIRNPRVRGVPELEEVLGDNSLFSGRFALTHDTRDSPFAPTEGHMFEVSYEQVFGTYSYPRVETDFRRYFLLRERVDRSGRHVLGTSLSASFSGNDTPVFENFFAGGYSTLRGFRFRGASPKNGDVVVGGEFSLLGSVEYLFPVTADDMLKGVVFCDYGTIEEEIEINKEDFRVAVGAGLRISVPAMGPAPIALDFAVPISREDTDRIQNFSFFMGLGR